MGFRWKSSTLYTLSIPEVEKVHWHSCSSNGFVPVDSVGTLCALSIQEESNGIPAAPMDSVVLTIE